MSKRERRRQEDARTHVRSWLKRNKARYTRGWVEVAVGAGVEVYESSERLAMRIALDASQEGTRVDGGREMIEGALEEWKREVES